MRETSTFNKLVTSAGKYASISGAQIGMVKRPINGGMVYDYAYRAKYGEDAIDFLLGVDEKRNIGSLMFGVQKQGAKLRDILHKEFEVTDLLQPNFAEKHFTDFLNGLELTQEIISSNTPDNVMRPDVLKVLADLATEVAEDTEHSSLVFHSNSLPERGGVVSLERLTNYENPVSRDTYEINLEDVQEIPFRQQETFIGKGLVTANRNRKEGVLTVLDVKEITKHMSKVYEEN